MKYFEIKKKRKKIYKNEKHFLKNVFIIKKIKNKKKKKEEKFGITIAHSGVAALRGSRQSADTTITGLVHWEKPTLSPDGLKRLKQRACSRSL